MVVASYQLLEFAPDEFAARWYPFGKEAPIIIDPQVNAGAPTVIKRRLTVQAIYKRRKAGFSISRIAEDTALSKDEVDQILLYADKIQE